jgi:hypothetical protein
MYLIVGVASGALTVRELVFPEMVKNEIATQPWTGDSQFVLSVRPQ